jgi:homogentisate 1,2-dioxygenase
VSDAGGSPEQPGPRLHIHRTFEECWVILDGEVRFTVDGETAEGRPGSVLVVPRGVAHTFQVLSPARWIGIFSPARYVAMLEEVGALMSESADDQAFAVLFGRYDTEIIR